MSAILIVNLILMSALISLLFFGVLVCCKYSQNNIYKKFLLGTIIFWIIALSTSFFVIFFAGGKLPASESAELLSMRGLLFGILCFLTLVSLPVVVLNARLLKLINWVKVATPMVITVAIYFCYHLIAGIDPFHSYYSIHELWDNIATAPVILRISIHLCFLLYIIIAIWLINRAVPLYNQYIKDKDNIADSDYNVDWVSGMVTRIWIVTFFYFAMRIMGAMYMAIPYLISVMIMFAYIIDMSIFHKMVDGVTPLNLLFSRKTGWRIVEEGVVPQPVAPVNSSNKESEWQLIDKWMNSERPYINPDFTIQKVSETFLDITAAELTELFKRHGESFQSIVREYRIAYACQIIQEMHGDILPKQLCGMVGFSHHSSFTRAFVAVQGVTPSEYVKKVRDTSVEVNDSGATPPDAGNILIYSDLGSIQVVLISVCWFLISRCYVRHN